MLVEISDTMADHRCLSAAKTAPTSSIQCQRLLGELTVAIMLPMFKRAAPQQSVHQQIHGDIKLTSRGVAVI